MQKRIAVLLALMHGESYGLEIIERVKDLTLGEVQLRQCSVYPALARLEAAGLATAYMQSDAEHFGRPRRYYRITARGQREARRVAQAIWGLMHLSVA